MLRCLPLIDVFVLRKFVLKVSEVLLQLLHFEL